MHQAERQKLRIRRWMMGLGAYAINLSFVKMAEIIELDTMPKPAFVLMITTVIAWNALIYLAFRTNFNLRFTDPSMTLIQMSFSYYWGIIPLYTMPHVRLLVILAILPSFCFGMLRLNLAGHLKAASTISLVYLGVLIADFLQQRPDFNLSLELFQFVVVLVMLVWFTVFGSFVSNMRHKLRRQGTELQKINSAYVDEIEQRKEAQHELEQALAKVKKLTGFIPICAHCKNIRDDSGYWTELEVYLSENSEAALSHSICPKCKEHYFPDYEFD
ncbi:MAG: hypothetical protein KDC35_19605 [Acidobacteria bacterium]|nr:hypothetical protein [Acidobacteriota bacterium]